MAEEQHQIEVLYSTKNIIKQNFGKRHVQIILLFFYNAIVFALTVNLSVAIVAMKDNKENPSFNQLDWNEFISGTILSSQFWGTTASAIPAGIIVQRFNCKTVLSIVVSISSIFTILLPFAATLNWQCVCAIRFITGAMFGFWLPCMHKLLSVWTHPTERTFLSTLAYSGAEIGIISMLSISGSIAVSPIGWPGIFYISGACGLLWTVFWHFHGSSSPINCLRISDCERKFLLSNSIAYKSNLRLHASKLLKSPSFWALIISNCGGGVAYNFFMTEIPTYVDNILNFNIQSSSLLSTLPYITFMFVSPTLGYFIDFLIRQKYCSIGVGRKIANSIGMIGPSICLIVLGFIKENIIFAMIVLTAALTLECGVNSGSHINHIDLSPNSCGILGGITLACGNLISPCGPMLVGYFVTDKNDASMWRNVFYTLGSIFFISNLIFCIWGSGEIQNWNKTDEKVLKYERVIEDSLPILSGPDVIVTI